MSAKGLIQCPAPHLTRPKLLILRVCKFVWGCGSDGQACQTFYPPPPLCVACVAHVLSVVAGGRHGTPAPLLLSCCVAHSLVAQANRWHDACHLGQLPAWT